MILHLFLSPFQHESRVLKECRALSELGWNESSMVVALWEPDLAQEEQVEEDIFVWRVALRTRNWPKNLIVQIIKYLEWMYRVVARMRSQDLTVIHAHSLSAMPVGVVLKWLTGVPVIYDAHELESETNGLSPLRRKLSRWMEALWIRGVDRTVTVCASIADWYVDAYGVERPTVIRNVPMRSAVPPERSKILRNNHDIPSDAFLYLYQGSLSPGRCIEALIEIFAGLSEQRHLVLMGYGVLEDQVREAAVNYSNVHFQPAVPPDQVLYYTASADIGLCLIENTCLSYFYSLPNKLFEYLLCGLPVLVNDMPEQRTIVERFECGWIAPPSLAQQRILIESINKGEIETRRSGAERAADSFDWEHEAVCLRNLYIEVTA